AVEDLTALHARELRPGAVHAADLDRHAVLQDAVADDPQAAIGRLGRPAVPAGVGLGVAARVGGRLHDVASVGRRSGPGVLLGRAAGVVAGLRRARVGARATAVVIRSAGLAPGSESHGE